MKKKSITTWAEIKDSVYGKKGTKRRDKLEEESNKMKEKINMEEIELTPKLKLLYIDENNVQGEELLAVCLFFRFYGQEGSAYLSLNNLNSEEPGFGIIESASGLHDSFIDQLEENWEWIVKVVKAYHEEWKLEIENE